MQTKTADHVKNLFVVLVIMFEGFFKTKSLEFPAEKADVVSHGRSWNDHFLADINTIESQITQFCEFCLQLLSLASTNEP